METVCAKYLVGCDGRHSPVRHLLGFAFEGDTYEPQPMLVGNVEVTVLDRDHWHAWPGHPDGAATLCPLPCTNQFQFQAVLKTAEPVEATLESLKRCSTDGPGGLISGCRILVALSIARMYGWRISTVRHGFSLLAMRRMSTRRREGKA